MKNKTKNQSGMTIVELVIALGLAGIAGIAYISLSGIVNNRVSLFQKGSQSLIGLVFPIELIKKDLKLATVVTVETSPNLKLTINYNYVEAPTINPSTGVLEAGALVPATITYELVSDYPNGCKNRSGVSSIGCKKFIRKDGSTIEIKDIESGSWCIDSLSPTDCPNISRPPLTIASNKRFLGEFTFKSTASDTTVKTIQFILDLESLNPELDKRSQVRVIHNRK